MGGHALSEGLTERKKACDYFSIKNAVLSRIADSCSYVFRVEEIQEMPEKEDFGDLDLLFVLHPGYTYSDFKRSITLTFCPNHVVRSGSITSFDFSKFQIDMIECSPENIGISRFVLSYGDRGMILGQIARANGFSLGINGLVISNTEIAALIGMPEVVDKITLSCDPEEIRRYMGLPLKDIELSTQLDVAQYCVSTPWYHPSQFTRKLNQEGKKRVAKRSFYRTFVEKIVEDNATYLCTDESRASLVYFFPCSLFDVEERGSEGYGQSIAPTIWHTPLGLPLPSDIQMDRAEEEYGELYLWMSSLYSPHFPSSIPHHSLLYPPPYTSR